MSRDLEELGVQRVKNPKMSICVACLRKSKFQVPKEDGVGRVMGDVFRELRVVISHY